ncbi:RNA polymerase sigma factor SigM [Gordonia sp. LSe1-13]|uniref:RNA polymerase sigma factor SigM n=1 Tax=Gordonia sesuvii TaxID=3116777 RepID=A0ABU7MH41_9ACTN|nr:RNA polymerase sigma factor SigM [Gordonia sp. LSe1-13]
MESDERPDSELLAAHVAGDRSAFGTLIRRHERYLWAVAHRTTGDPDDAADAMQNALFSAHRNAHRFRGDAQVRTWLHRLVVNAGLDRLRRRGRVTMPLPSGDMPAPSSGIDHDDRIDISSALAALPAHQRAAIVAVDIEGLSVADAADRLGVAPGTIKSRCARGRAALAVTLGHLRSA